MISFVIPVYKKPSEQFNKAVKSLLDMSEKDIEVIAVFDGPDMILEPHAEEWTRKDKRFRHTVIDHGGACKARNEGTRLAKGDYVACWDADCYAEPEMAMMWLRTFSDNPDADFVYSGYKFTDPNLQGFDSEPFDPWLLEKYNYIASMFPVKREKLVPWDEELGGLQDWDFWRRVVKAGGRGRFIPGYGFWTEYPDPSSISGQAGKRVERIRKVREKHGDKSSGIYVFGQTFRRDAILLAKTLDADFFNGPYWMTEEYKLVISFGLHPWDLENAAGIMRSQSGAKKAIYWTGYDADNFSMSPYVQVKALMSAIDKEISHNLAVDDKTSDLLTELGLKNVETVVFPHGEGDTNVPLPDEFKVLALADEKHKLHLEAVKQAMPDVKFDVVVPEKAYDPKDYTAFLQFTDSRKLFSGNRNALMLGRYVISNIQEPYAGYVEIPGDDITPFVNEVYDRIRELEKTKEVNKEARDYYLEESSPEKFKAKVKSLLLEVVQ